MTYAARIGTSPAWRAFERQRAQARALAVTPPRPAQAAPKKPAADVLAERNRQVDAERRRRESWRRQTEDAIRAGVADAVRRFREPAGARQVLAAAAERFGLTVEAIKGISKAIPLVVARAWVAHELRDGRGWSREATGRLLNRDHTTITNLLQAWPRERVEAYRPPPPKPSPLSVACEACGADVGAACCNVRGRIINPHWQRRRAAKARQGGRDGEN